MSIAKKRLNLAAAALLVLAVAAAAALWSHSSAQAEAPTGATPVPLAQMTPGQAAVTPTKAVATVDSTVTGNFALFRDTQPTAMPADLAAQLASPGRYGRNASLARTINTPYGQGWIIPGDGYLCIAVPDPVSGYGESCTTVAVALKKGLWLRLTGDGPTTQTLDTVVAPDDSTVKLGSDPVSTGAATRRVAPASNDADVVSEFVAPGAAPPSLVAGG